MKLLKTIEKLIRESEDAYNKALESSFDEKEIDRLEKNYKDSLKLMKTYNLINTNFKKNYSIFFKFSITSSVVIVLVHSNSLSVFSCNGHHLQFPGSSLWSCQQP